MRGVCWCTLNTSLPQTENVLRAGGSQGLLQHVGVPLAPGHRREDAPPEGPGYPHLQACLLLPQPRSPCGFCQVSLFSSEPRLRYVGRAWCPLIPSSWPFQTVALFSSVCQTIWDAGGSGHLCLSFTGKLWGLCAKEDSICHRCIPCRLFHSVSVSSPSHTSPVESGVSVPSYFCAIVTIAGDAVTEESQ